MKGENLLRVRPYPSTAKPEIRVECYVVVGGIPIFSNNCSLEWDAEYIKETPGFVLDEEFKEITKAISEGLLKGLKKVQEHYGWGLREE